MLKTIKLTWTFYQGFLFASSLITICCLALLRNYGFSIFREIFWFKLITLGLTYYFINDYKKKEYLYYRNLGMSKTILWAGALGFDFTLFTGLIILIS